MERYRRVGRAKRPDTPDRWRTRDRFGFGGRRSDGENLTDRTIHQRVCPSNHCRSKHGRTARLVGGHGDNLNFLADGVKRVPSFSGLSFRGLRPLGPGCRSGKCLDGPAHAGSTMPLELRELALTAVENACHDAVARMNPTWTNECQEFFDFSTTGVVKTIRGQQQGVVNTRNDGSQRHGSSESFQHTISLWFIEGGIRGNMIASKTRSFNHLKNLQLSKKKTNPHILPQYPQSPPS